MPVAGGHDHHASELNLTIVAVTLATLVTTLIARADEVWCTRPHHPAPLSAVHTIHTSFEKSPTAAVTKMMSAPPPYSTPPALFSSDHHRLRAATSALSPASTDSGSDSTAQWASMVSCQYPTPTTNNPTTARPPLRTSMSPSANESHDFTFITGSKPDDFKDKVVMTTVRKRAMGSYLEKEKKSRPSVQRTRLNSEDSTRSRASIGSDQQDDTIANNDALRNLRWVKRPSRRPSSPIRSPASSNANLQLMPTSKAQITRLPPSIDVVLPSAPMVEGMRPGRLMYDKNPVAAFQSPVFQVFPSIGKPLDPFKTMHQPQHPGVSVEELKFHCSRFFGTRAMGRHWIPTLVKSPHAFLSTLCIASAHHDAISSRSAESFQTLALRQEVIHLIGRNILDREQCVSDFNIIALTQLICSEIIAGEKGALGYHEGGIEKMVNLRGGLRQLGVNGRLASTLSWLSLESAILREEKPRAMYADFCTSYPVKTYQPTATIPESPIFCPRDDYVTIKRSQNRSQRCSSRTMDILTQIRMMTEFFLNETAKSRQNEQTLKNLYKKITTQYQPVSELAKDNVLTPSDWTYEAVRIASILQATAIIKRIPLSEALKYAAPPPLYTPAPSSCAPSPSHVSPITTFRHDSPVTNFSTSPSYVTSPSFSNTTPSNFFPLNNQKPPLSSALTPSSSSENLSNLFFPPAPTPNPAGPSALLISLKTAIDSSDLSDCWSDMAGVLLWIGLVAGATSHKSDKVVKKWFSALAVRCSIVLCFEHPEAVHCTLLKMGEVIEGVGFRSGNEAITRREGVKDTGAGAKAVGTKAPISGKKRRL